LGTLLAVSLVVSTGIDGSELVGRVVPVVEGALEGSFILEGGFIKTGGF
jgi:hypothetical protein